MTKKKHKHDKEKDRTGGSPEVSFRIPSHINDAITAAILQADKDIRGEDANGVTTEAVAGAVDRDEKLNKLLAKYGPIIKLSFIKRRTTDVLGADNDSIESSEKEDEPFIPGLRLPRRSWCPPRGEFPGRWKTRSDLTPNECNDIYETRQDDIQGRIAKAQPYALLRDTALARGCDPNKPVSTVFPAVVNEQQ